MQADGHAQVDVRFRGSQERGDDGSVANHVDGVVVCSAVHPVEIDITGDDVARQTGHRGRRREVVVEDRIRGEVDILDRRHGQPGELVGSQRHVVRSREYVDPIEAVEVGAIPEEERRFPRHGVGERHSYPTERRAADGDRPREGVAALELDRAEVGRHQQILIDEPRRHEAGGERRTHEDVVRSGADVDRERTERVGVVVGGRHADQGRHRHEVEVGAGHDRRCAVDHGTGDFERVGKDDRSEIVGNPGVDRRLEREWREIGRFGEDLDQDRALRREERKRAERVGDAGRVRNRSSRRRVEEVEVHTRLGDAGAVLHGTDHTVTGREREYAEIDVRANQSLLDEERRIVVQPRHDLTEHHGVDALRHLHVEEAEEVGVVVAHRNFDAVLIEEFEIDARDRVARFVHQLPAEEVRDQKLVLAEIGVAEEEDTLEDRVLVSRPDRTAELDGVVTGERREQHRLERERSRRVGEVHRQIELGTEFVEHVDVDAGDRVAVVIDDRALDDPLRLERLPAAEDDAEQAEGDEPTPRLRPTSVSLDVRVQCSGPFHLLTRSPSGPIRDSPRNSTPAPTTDIRVAIAGPSPIDSGGSVLVT